MSKPRTPRTTDIVELKYVGKLLKDTRNAMSKSEMPSMNELAQACGHTQTWATGIFGRRNNPQKTITRPELDILARMLSKTAAWFEGRVAPSNTSAVESKHASTSDLRSIFPIKQAHLVIPVHHYEGKEAGATTADKVAEQLLIAALDRLEIEATVSVARKLVNRSQNLVLVCGPGGNTLSGELLRKKSLPFRFEKSRSGEWVVTSTEKHAGPYARKADGSNDYAMVLRMANPWSKGPHLIYLAAGITGSGTYAAAQLLTRQPSSILEQLAHRGIDKADPFAALLECDTMEFEGVQAKSYRPLQIGFVDVKSVARE